ncbi:MAG: insulinase family protein, partial [Desulfobacterota bacterium]|nr:insulinase family protein [Thermodesulfobacteriota bacterium]
VTEHIPYVQSISIGIWVKTGSRDETNEENGIAHFIEHMLFKGTKRRSALAIAKEIDSVGGVLNASTSREFTNFFAKVLSRDFDLAVDLLSDIFLNSLFSPSEINRERQVIFEEIKMVEDTPDEYVQDLFSQNFFARHPLGHPILGSYNSIQKITRKKLIEFFHSYYLNPLRIIVSVAGNLNHAQVVKAIDRTLGKIKSNQKKEPIWEPPEIFPGIKIFNKDLEQVHICLGTKGFAQPHPSRYAGYILNTILGGSMSSRLFQEVREKRGLAYSIFSYNSAFQDTGILAVYAGTSRDKFSKVIEVIIKEIKKLKTQPLKKSELKKAKEQLKGNLLLAWENTDVRMSRMATGELYFGKYIPLKNIMDKIDQVTVKDIQALSDDLFQKKYLSLIALGGIEEKNIKLSLLEI